MNTNYMFVNLKRHSFTGLALGRQVDRQENKIKRRIYTFELYVRCVREREDESGVYAIDNIHGQKYSSAAYRLSAYVVA